MVDFETLDLSTLISRKIWVTEKFCDFHTVYRYMSKTCVISTFILTYLILDSNIDFLHKYKRPNQVVGCTKEYIHICEWFSSIGIPISNYLENSIWKNLVFCPLESNRLCFCYSKHGNLVKTEIEQRLIFETFVWKIFREIKY